MLLSLTLGCPIEFVSSSSIDPALLQNLPDGYPSYLKDDFSVANRLVDYALQAFHIPKDNRVYLTFF